MRRYILSKWAKTKAILASPKVREYVPLTLPMNKQSLQRMLHQNKMVYIKPTIGTFGNGVMRVEWKEGETSPYIYQNDLKIRHFEQYSSLFQAISKDVRKRSYLVQRGIHLLRYGGNRFDLRVMVQQTPKRKWETTGIIGRVAHPKRIVTNFHNGGKLKAVETLLSAYLAKDEKQRYIRKLEQLGTSVAGALHQKYQGIKEIGVDVALDPSLKPWILEVNTSPDPYIFRHLKDKQIFNKIRRYNKSYNRL